MINLTGASNACYRGTKSAIFTPVPYTWCAVIRGSGGSVFSPYISTCDLNYAGGSWAGYMLGFTTTLVSLLVRYGAVHGEWRWTHSTDTTKENDVIVSYANASSADVPTCWINGANMDSARATISSPSGDQRLSQTDHFIIGSRQMDAGATTFSTFQGHVTRVAIYNPLATSTYRTFTQSEATRWHRTRGYPHAMMYTQNTGGGLAPQALYDVAGVEGAACPATMRNIYQQCGDFAFYPHLTKVGAFNFARPAYSPRPAPIQSLRQ